MTALSTPAAPASHTDTFANRLRNRLAAMPISAKLRLASLCNVAAVVIMLVSIVVGGKIALDLRAQRMVVSEAVVSAAELARTVESARLDSYRLADGGGQRTGAGAGGRPPDRIRTGR